VERYTARAGSIFRERLLPGLLNISATKLLVNAKWMFYAMSPRATGTGYRYCHRLSPIMSAQLVHDVPEMNLNGL
jgi:hypothetical protein